MTPDDDDDLDFEYSEMSDPDSYDRNGVLGADGMIYSDADPGL